MNRGLTIRIPDPDIEDLEIFSITIAKFYLGEKLEEDIKNFFMNLAHSYYKYKEELKNDNRLKEYEIFMAIGIFFI